MVPKLTLTSEMKIKVQENGPYLVTGSIPLLEVSMLPDDQGLSIDWQEDRRYPIQPAYKLCRCGQSRNKPFCDDSHLRVKFNGAEIASRDPYLSQVEKTEGPELVLTDAQDLCASARFCDRLGGVWDRTRASNDPESRRIAIEIVGKCPAGRLVVWDKQGKAIEPEFEPSIALVTDPVLGVLGPIWVRSGIRIESADGHLYEIRNRVTLCRCGKSKNKPFCDGKHCET
ncbi:MAG: CDGSH iron-sulfur domain-containing protein [Omnitrophica WOR_2 bacterium]